MTVLGARARPFLSFLLAAGLIATVISDVARADASQSVSARTRCQWMSTPVHESTNPKTRSTLLTTWPNEAAKAREKEGFTTNVGTLFSASRIRHAGLIGVHRLYNAHTHQFLWTKSESEVSKATKKLGYADQGIDFYTSVGGGGCLTPVYRYAKSGARRYVTTPAQRASLRSTGWRYESIAFYARAGSATANPAPATSKPTTSKPAVSTKTPTSSGGPLGQQLYLTKSTSAWTAYKKARGATKSLLYQIASTPTAIWLGGRSTDRATVDATLDRAAAHHTTPVFVLYAIPNRDCGGYSAGGLNSVRQYENWINSVRQGIAGRKSVIIVEPDAIGMSCLASAKRADRLTMLSYAISKLSTSKTWVYIHAGSSGLDPKSVAATLKKAGIANARGFAVNVSSFDTTASEISYGKAVMKALRMNKHFVIDTSRNGLGRYTGGGSAPAWCNPPGRAVGTRPTTSTASAAVDAYLWIKAPGGSDGQCHSGDPAPGIWYQSYALGLVQRALDKGIITKRAIP